MLGHYDDQKYKQWIQLSGKGHRYREQGGKLSGGLQVPYKGLYWTLFWAKKGPLWN